jgi:cathepsin E
MFSVASLVAVVSLALAVTAEPIQTRDAPLIRLPFVKHVNLTGSVNLLKKDQARATLLKTQGREKALGKRAVISTPATNEVLFRSSVTELGFTNNAGRYIRC